MCGFFFKWKKCHKMLIHFYKSKMYVRIDLHLLSSFKLGLFIIAIYNLNTIDIFDFISLGLWSEWQCFSHVKHTLFYEII